MREAFIFFTVIIILSIVLGCAKKPIYSDFDNYGFNVDNDSVYKNPPADKARIYAFRAKGFVGGAIKYYISVHYNGLKCAEKNQFDRNLEVEYINKCDDVYGDSDRFAFLNMSESSFAAYSDIAAGGRVTIFGRLESDKTIEFNPAPGKIYCLESNVPFSGKVPQFSIVPKSRCDEIAPLYLNEANQKKFETYKAKFDSYVLGLKNK